MANLSVGAGGGFREDEAEGTEEEEVPEVPIASCAACAVDEFEVSTPRRSAKPRAELTASILAISLASSALSLASFSPRL